MNSISTYRKAARKSLSGHWAQAALLSVILLIICSLSSFIRFVSFDSTDLRILEGIDSLYSVFLVLPVCFAFFVVFLRLIRKPGTNLLNSFFSNCFSNYGRALCSMLLLVVISTCFAIAGAIVSITLVSIPFSLLDISFDLTDFSSIHSKYAFLRLFKSLNLIIYACCCGFLFLISLIPMVMYLYKICLFPFIIEDNPNIGIRDAYHLSKVLMNGQRMRLFLLDLSFIGWYLLGSLTLGVVFFWIMPYQQMARAHFYEELKTNFDKNGKIYYDSSED